MVPGGATAILVAVLALATPAFADVIPLGAAFGNAAGCEMFLHGFPTAGAVLLTPDSFAGDDIACDFTRLAGASAVAAICSGDERAGEVEIAVVAGDRTFTVALDDHRWGPLPRCPGELVLDWSPRA